VFTRRRVGVVWLFVCVVAGLLPGVTNAQTAVSSTSSSTPAATPLTTTLTTTTTSAVPGAAVTTTSGLTESTSSSVTSTTLAVPASAVTSTTSPTSPTTSSSAVTSSTVAAGGVSSVGVPSILTVVSVPSSPGDANVSLKPAAASAAVARAGVGRAAPASAATAAAAASVVDPVLADGPVGYWKFGDASSGTGVALSEGTGLLSGSYVGSVTASLDTPNGRFATSGVFGGGSCDGVALDQTATRFTGEYSIETWVKTTIVRGIMFRYRNYGYSIAVEGGKFSGGGYDYGAGSNTLINDGQWHHVAFVRSLTSAAVYVDGEKESEQYVPNPGTYFDGYYGTSIGRDGDACDGTIPSFAGKMTGFALFAKALSPGEVLKHAGKKRLIPASQAIGGLSQSAVGVSISVALGFADPINTSTGAFTHEVTDVGVSGRGVGLDVMRSYDSLSSVNSVFGPTWAWGLSEQIVPTSLGVNWLAGTGQEISFAADGAGGFVAPAGVVAQVRTLSGGGWELVRQDQVVSRFDVGGRLVSRRDRSGEGLTFTYDVAGKLTLVTDAAGQTLTFTYGTAGVSNGLVTRVATSDARVVKYGYALVAGKSRLVSVTDPRLKVTTYTYDAAGLLVSEVNPLGQAQFVNAYDAKGRVVSQADATGAVSTLVFDDVNETTTMTDAAGAVSVHSYSGFVLGATQTPAGSSSIERDTRLNPSGYTDENGKRWNATYDGRGNMLTRTGPTGLVESWTYDSMNNPLTATDTTGVVTTYTYDVNGRVLTESRANTTRSYAWNPDGTLASSTDPRGLVTTYTYDSAGRVLSQTTPSGAITRYEYDPAGRVTRMIPPRGNLAGAVAANFDMVYRYDKNGNQTLVQGPGVKTTSVFDDANRLITQTQADGGITTYTYNAAGEVLTMTAPDGGDTTYAYSPRGERLSQTDPVGAKTTWTYDGAGRVATMVEPRGNVAGANPADYQWSYTYDGVGRKLTETDPTGRVTTNSYDALGRLVAQTRPDGTTTTTYDPQLQERLVTTTDQAGRSTVTRLDELGRLESSTDTRGFVTYYSYDQAGNKLSQNTPDGGVTTYTYDDENRVASMTDPRGNANTGCDFCPLLPSVQVFGLLKQTLGPPDSYTTTYGYDIEGHQTTVTDPLGRVTTVTYDSAGRAVTTTDPGGRVTNLAFDVVGRVRQVNVTGLGATKYTYDTVGNLRTRTDQKLRVTTYDYDLGRRLVKQTDPAGRFFTHSYDVDGRKTQIIDAVANAANDPTLGTTTMTYDRLGRVTGRTYSDGTPSVSYTYDVQGRRASMTDGTGVTTYTYDTLNRLTAKTLPGGVTMTYAYDAGDNVTEVADGSGGSTQRIFDVMGRLQSVQYADQSTVSYDYDIAGFSIRTNFPGGVNQGRTYDGAGQLTSLINQNASGVLRRYTFQRDGAGNPVKIETSGPTGVVASESQLLTYDSSYRLRKQCWSATTCAVANSSAWTYDTVGNRLTEKIGVQPQTSYTYDNVDQLTQTVQGTAAPVVFTYNANGDQTKAGNVISTFNTARQTVGVTTPTGAVTYAYDGDGNRVSSLVTEAGGSLLKTTYDWDTSSGGLANVVAEHDDTGVVQRRYSYGNELLSIATPQAKSFALTDPLGTVTHLVSPTGVVQAEYTTSPWGVANKTNVIDPTVASNPIRFTGQYTDPFTKNVYLRARNYNPTLGTFTQTDPLEPDVGSAYPSPYVYGNNNPGVFRDPSGLRGVLSMPNGLALTDNEAKTRTKPEPELGGGRRQPSPTPNPTSGSQTFYHGTIASSALNIIQGGIRLQDTGAKDFGIGFYTTRDPELAKKRAIKIADSNPDRNKPGGSLAIIVGFNVLDYEWDRLLVLSLGKTEAKKVIRRFQANRKASTAFDVIEGPVLRNPSDFRNGKPAEWIGGGQQAWKSSNAISVLNRSNKFLLPVVLAR
jgi:RHS repeat-associated protein